MPVVEHAVIAAAGLGSRLGLGRPKCLVEVGGQPLIHHQLQLLAGIPDVRVVVGFEEQSVIEAVLAVRSNVIFVRNPAFRSTTTLASYSIGSEHLDQPCLFMDADILFDSDGFAAFLAACKGRPLLVGVTETKTSDAVFAHLSGGNVIRFTRTEPGPLEWANLCWLPPRYCSRDNIAVFEHLSKDLPLPAHVLPAFEIDTPEDYKRLIERFPGQGV